MKQLWCIDTSWVPVWTLGWMYVMDGGDKAIGLWPKFGRGITIFVWRAIWQCIQIQTFFTNVLAMYTCYVHKVKHSCQLSLPYSRSNILPKCPCHVYKVKHSSQMSLPCIQGQTFPPNVLAMYTRSNILPKCPYYAYKVKHSLQMSLPYIQGQPFIPNVLAMYTRSNILLGYLVMIQGQTFNP